MLIKLKDILLVSLLVCLSGASQATLFDRGGGMIYDDVLGITWLQNANLGGAMQWNDAVAWADALEFGGYSDWRLTSMDVNDDETIIDCSSASEAACRDNELGYMYYQNLMGSPGGGLTGNQGLFTDIQPSYASGTEYVPLSSRVWVFYFTYGTYSYDFQYVPRPVWAVRDGDVDIEDGDGDGVANHTDNCTLVPNADQRDSDRDGQGNVCDFDYNNDCVTNFADLTLFADTFGLTVDNNDFNKDVDIDGNGVINFLDFGVPPNNFAAFFTHPPGPSATECVPAF